MHEDIINYVNEAAPTGTAPLLFKYLEGVQEMGCTFQLDKPLIRVQAASGAQIATLHVPTGEVQVVTG